MRSPAGKSCRAVLAFFVLMSVLLWSRVPAFAQGPSLDSVCRDLTAFDVTTGSFVQRRSAPGLSRPLTSKGTFVICGEGIAWKTASPISSLLAVSRDKIIQSAPDGRKTVIDGSGNQTFKNIAETLATIFSGDRAALEKNFRVSFSAQGSDWTITLVPKDSTIAAAMKSVVMDGSSGVESFINSVRIEEQDGAGIEYSFSEQSHKSALSADEKAYFSVE